ncbi:MAG TPA: hypothetical protein VE909_05475 [Xanthobacteraceae bacterium]|nr:hypothetical protein [Xanthobacteraceae bacterium]
MIDRRGAIRRIAFALAAGPLGAAAPLASARAQQSFQQYVPFLIDLSGWTGNQPDGMAMAMPGASIVTASREYRRGDARITVQVVTGPAAQGALGVTRSEMKLETADMHVSASSIDGLQVARTFTVKDKAGAVIVALGPAAMFTLTFNGVAEDEALTLARQFDWKGIQAAAPK